MTWASNRFLMNDTEKDISRERRRDTGAWVWLLYRLRERREAREREGERGRKNAREQERTSGAFGFYLNTHSEMACYPQTLDLFLCYCSTQSLESIVYVDARVEVPSWSLQYEKNDEDMDRRAIEKREQTFATPPFLVWRREEKKKRERSDSITFLTSIALPVAPWVHLYNLTIHGYAPCHRVRLPLFSPHHAFHCTTGKRTNSSLLPYES